MPEILTESFCERCGTRYTFESAAPTKAKKLGRFKTLSKGLKNYVLSDETSLDEAMAEARSDEERQVTAQQLDAFHATFNFCMSCRQYTCGNCWNEADGLCLTCAPHLGRDIMPAPFPTFQSIVDAAALPDPAPVEEIRIDEAWPTADLPAAATAADDSNGHFEVEDFDVAARLAQLGGGTATEDRIEPAADSDASLATGESDAAFAAAEPPVAAEAELAPAAAEPVADKAIAGAPDWPPATDIDGRAAAAAARTGALLGRFRPGQSLDAELAAYEAAVAASDESAVADAAPIDAEPLVAAAVDQVPASIVEPEPIAPEPEPVAAQAEAISEPVVIEAAASQPKVVAAEAPQVAEPAPRPEPIAAEAPPVAAEPAVAPVAAEPRKDRVEQPTWRIVAPDSPAATPTGRDQVDPGLAAAASATPPAAQPEWPSTPQWPTAAPAIPYPAEHLAVRSTNALWAASARDVVNSPGGPAVAGIQPCSNCGLSLSATARFCRRCGSRQGG